MRGLKLIIKHEEGSAKLVAPLVGAWIETYLPKVTIRKSDMSHPSWVRGLKLSKVSWVYPDLQSHPSWVRGLKQGGSLDCRGL